MTVAATPDAVHQEAFSIARARWMASKMSLVYNGNLAGAMGFVLGLWWTADRQLLLGWLALKLGYHLACRVHTWRALQQPVETVKQADFWHRYVGRSGWFQGLIWGLAAWLFVPAAPDFALGIALFSLAVVVSGGGPMMSSHPGAYSVFTLLVMLPVVARLAPATLPLPVYAFLFTAFVLSQVLLVWRSYETVAQSLRERLEKARLADALGEQLQIAEQAVADKSRFLAAVSHDLRQPLTAIALFVARVGRGDAAEQATTRRGLRAASVNLSTLLDSLLELARADAGQIQGRPRPLALRPLLEALVAGLGPEAASKGLRLRVVGRARWVNADPLLLRRVLLNLLGNAIKFTPRGRVLVGTRPVPGGVRVAVWDSGPGIAEADAQRIFGEYQQLGDGGSHPAGYGLGLAIARRLAAVMGSEIGLRSLSGRGSCFFLTLPGAVEVRPEPVAVPERLVAASSAPEVWLVEDDPQTAETLGETLRGWGHPVRAFADAASVRGAADTGTPALLISDYHLPGGERGSALIAELRARSPAPLPAVLITGDPQAVRADPLADGIPVLTKPVPLGRLRLLLRSPPASALRSKAG